MASLGLFESGEACAFDVAHLIETRLLITSNSGGGKSWLIRRLLEQTAGQIQQIVIDPDGEFATLREQFDFVIAAAHGGDALAHPKTAQLLARRLLETGVSAILDIYDLKKHERQSFVRIFCETLVEAPKHLWHPVLIVLDEAHIFAPESAPAEAKAAVADLATRGRKRGFALAAATQRLAKLDKDTAADLVNKLIGRTTLDVDIKRVADELGMTYRQAWEAVHALNPGEFYAVGPAISPAVQRLKVGSVRTTHPKVGDRTLRAPPKPTAAIRAVLPKLADLPREAETEARTVAELKAQVTGLRRELTLAQRAPAAVPGRPAATPDPKLLVAAEERGYQRGWSAAQAAWAQALKTLKSSLGQALESAFQSVMGTLKSASVAGASPAARKPAGAALSPAARSEPAVLPAHAGAPRRPVAAAPSRVAAAAAPASGESTEALTGPEQRIVDAIAWLETMTSNPVCQQTAVAFLAGYTFGAGSFNNPRARLNGRGLVQYVPGERIRLTEAGRSLAQVPASPLTVEELHRCVLERLPGPEQRILKPLLASYPNPMAGADVAQAANYVFGAGSFNNPRSRLKSLGLIEYVGQGQLVAASALFPTAA